MNIALAKEIHTNATWCVAPNEINGLLALWNLAKSYDKTNEEQLNNSGFIDISLINEDIQIISDLSKLKAGSKGIGIINLNGAITLNGGSSTKGMKQLSSELIEMGKDDRIKAIGIIANSGGGSSYAVDIMQNAIKRVRNEFYKTVGAFIPLGGVACSACYGIITACNFIYSENGLSRVGSCGTLFQGAGFTNGDKSNDGQKVFRIYASKSTMKNKEIEEVLNNDNVEFVVNNLLDPMNDNFLSRIEANRSALNGSNWDTGETVFTKDGVGTYIDKIASFEEFVNELIYLENKNNNNTNTSNMTIDELKVSNTALYNEIFNAGLSQGVKNEKDRVGSWMAHASTDLEKVKLGISSGEAISATDTQEFIVKQTALNAKKDLETVNQEEVTADDGNDTVLSKEEAEVQNFYKSIADKI